MLRCGGAYLCPEFYEYLRSYESDAEYRDNPPLRKLRPDFPDQPVYRDRIGIERGAAGKKISYTLQERQEGLWRK